jgi:hypothetical protein
MTFSPVILILEDIPDGQELLSRAFLAQKVDENNLFIAGSVAEALSLIRDNHFHGVSIDQRLPMQAQGAVADEHGLAFVKLEKWPLAKRTVYTVHGDIDFANLAGFVGVEYRQKKLISVFDYAAEFVRDLRENYVEKSLIAASKILPHSLAAPALKAAQAKGGRNWPEFFRNFSELRERLLRLTLAVTLAAQARKSPWNEGLRAQEIERALHRLWRPVPLPFRRFVTQPGWEPGEALFEALTALRKLRNAVAHYDYQNYIAKDFDEQHGSIIAIIDLLTFFCELPIMHDPRIHQKRRGWLSFHKMGPNKTLVEGELEADFDPPAANDNALYIPWRTPSGPQLLDLSPWLIARRGPSKELEFNLLLEQKREPL